MAKCMQCGGAKKMASAGVGKASSMAKRKMAKGGVKKYAAGGSTLSGSAIKKAPVQLYGMPQENMGTSGQYGQMKKGGAKKTLTKAQTGRAMSKYTFSPDYTSEGTKIQSGVKYGKGDKRKYLDINPSAGTVTKTSFNKNNESTTKTKNVGVGRANKMVSKITPKSKTGGPVKKPLTKAQTGRAMTSGPFDKATTDYLNTRYPGTAVRIPYDPEYYAEPQSQSDYTPMAELEADDRRNTEARMRSANNREDFNAGSMEGYRRGGAKKAMMKKGGAVKKMAKGGTKFPDLTGDGKVTKADVLKGRGVIKKTGGTPKAKFGMSVKVQRSPKAGKVTAVGRGYAAVGKREPGRIIKKTIIKKK